MYNNMCLVWMGCMGWLQSWLWRWYEFLLDTEIKKHFLGYKIRRRTNNEDDGASCDGDGADTMKCSDNTNTCPSCFNYYENCEKIPTSYCTDLRFQNDMERLCEKYCGKCSDRRRRHSARAGMTIQPVFVSHLDELLHLL